MCQGRGTSTDGFVEKDHRLAPFVDPQQRTTSSVVEDHRIAPGGVQYQPVLRSKLGMDLEGLGLDWIGSISLSSGLPSA